MFSVSASVLHLFCPFDVPLKKLDIVKCHSICESMNWQLVQRLDLPSPYNSRARLHPNPNLSAIPFADTRCCQNLSLNKRSETSLQNLLISQQQRSSPVLQGVERNEVSAV